MDACIATVFESFISASTFKGILTAFAQLCCLCNLDSSDRSHFYYKLRNRVSSWKAKHLWDLLDKRMSQSEYQRQEPGADLKVLIIGAGPCGLRMAIECALLGCKVVVVEKRTKFSRNNVLHIWPFVIEDLRSLGAKLLYPKFCAGSIDHISMPCRYFRFIFEPLPTIGIVQLQCILLKVALLFGVEVFENVSFAQLLEPRVENGVPLGWTAALNPADHFLTNYEFNVLISADGKRNSIPGFRRIEFRGKLAIAITANFVNTHSEAEERVAEISGTSFIFRQRFFREMREAIGIDLENIVYYKDETHYFVMTAKKQSLLDKGVIVKDYDDISLLLSADNVNLEMLMEYARQAADFACENALPRLDFALNHHGQPDVAMFDFTSLYSAENSCRYLQRNDCPLLMAVVGDSLHEPFWPTGSGCARGFLGVLDTAWMLRNYGLGSTRILDMIAERESIYKLLAQSTPETLHRNIKAYTVDPRSRYPSMPECTLTANQVQWLCTCDVWPIPLDLMPIHSQSRGNCRFELEQEIVRWLQLCLAPYRLRVDNVTYAFTHTPLLAAVLHRFCPDRAANLFINGTMEWKLDVELCLSTIQQLWGIPPPTSSDKQAVFAYLGRLYFVLRDKPMPPASTFLVRTVKTRSDVENGQKGTDVRKKLIESDKAVLQRHHQRLKRLMEAQALDDIEYDCGERKVEKLSSDLLDRVEAMLRGKMAKKPTKLPSIAIRKLNPEEVKDMEEKLQKTAMGCLLYRRQEPVLSSKEAKIIALKTAGLKEKALAGFRHSSGRFDSFDQSMEKLDKRLRLQDTSGAIRVSQLTQMHSTNIGQLQVGSRPGKRPPPPPKREPSEYNARRNAIPLTDDPKLFCHVCRREVYLAERVNVDNVSFHKDCFRCAFCNCVLRLNGYGIEYVEQYGKLFFCNRHLNCSLRDKLSRIEMLSPGEAPSEVVVEEGDKEEQDEHGSESSDGAPYYEDKKKKKKTGERIEFVLSSSASSAESEDDDGSCSFVGSLQNLFKSISEASPSLEALEGLGAVSLTG